MLLIMSCTKSRAKSTLSPPHKLLHHLHKPPPTSPSPSNHYHHSNQKPYIHSPSRLIVFPNNAKDPSCSYSEEYEQEFPALTAFEHLDSHTKHDWKIKNPTTIGPTRHANTISPAEATLNWQSEKRCLPEQSCLLKPSTRKEPTFSQESQSIADVVASTKTPDVLPIQKVNPVSMFLNSLTQTDKPQNTQFIAPVIKPQKDYEEFDNVESFEHLFMAEPENAESTVQFDAEEYEEHQENLN
ncbi:hypothetical protein Tco_0472734 [Tanacetum coccineum]